MTRIPVSAQQVGELIAHRIASGEYQAGSQLPGIRELAAAVGANRNTVAKVYRQLAELGLLRIAPGHGAFVIAGAESLGGALPIAQIGKALTDAIRRAKFFGIERRTVEELIVARVAQVYDVEPPPRVAFVECNRYDAEAGARELAAGIGMPVEPLLIDNIRSADFTVGYQVISTSLFHLSEVRELLKGNAPSVVAVNTTPDRAALAALAGIPPGTRVGVIVSNHRGARSFAHMVRVYCRGDARVEVSPSEETLRALVGWAESLVCSLSCQSLVESHRGDKPLITLAFHVEHQSLQQFRDAIRVAERKDDPGDAEVSAF